MVKSTVAKSGSPAAVMVEIHSQGTIGFKITILDCKYSLLPLALPKIYLKIYMIPRRDTDQVLRFPRNGMVLLKKHGGGIFTSIRDGRNEAKSPKTSDWIFVEAMQNTILWFLTVVKLRHPRVSCRRQAG
jgi:hypothetical protein